jgi:heptosyltransferase-3
MGRVNRKRDRWLKRGLERVLRPFFRRPSMSLPQILAEKPRRILVVRQHNQMGDMLCAVPTLRAIAETFTPVAMALVTAPVNDGVVRGNPHLQEVFLFDKVRLRRSPLGVLRFLRQLRRFHADLAIVLNSVSYSGTSSWIAVLSGAKRIIGGDSRPFGWSFSDWLYNLQMPSSQKIETHAIDHSLAPLLAVGITTEDKSTELKWAQEDGVRAERFLSNAGSPPYVAVHPGAGKEANRWPAGRFAALLERLHDAGWSPWCVEGPADHDATEEVAACLSWKLPVLRGVSVRTVGAALAASDLAVVNDTGVMHVAGAVGVPTVALFGPTPARQWKPPGEHVVALQSPDGTMDSLSEEEVWTAVRQHLSAVAGVGKAARTSQTPPASFPR